MSYYQIKPLPIDYEKVLAAVQNKKSSELFALYTEDLTKEECRAKVMAFIVQQLTLLRIIPSDYTLDEYAQLLYDDMDAYGKLTQPLEDENVEGFNINSWEDIRVTFVDGSEVKIGGFSSPQKALDIITRLMQASKVTLDDAVPIAEASLGSNIRITALRYPILDKTVMVAAYIRKIREKVFSDKEYVDMGFATEKELNMIHIFAKRNVSEIIAGKVNTGKTSFIKNILMSIPNSKEIGTIETGSREMNLIKRDDSGNVINNVVHMLTRPHTTEKQNITQQKLVMEAVRLNTEVIAVTEIRDTEAVDAQEASLTTHTVITSIHSGPAGQAHRRIARLTKRVTKDDASQALIDACDAFPIVIFIHQTEDKVRRIMNVSEAYIENDNVIYNTLWEYRIKSNTIEDGKVKIFGEHIQINNPSPQLIEKLTLYGATDKEIKSLMKGEN